MTEPADRWTQIQADYEAGLYPSVRALAAAYGLTHTSINQRAKAHGWKKPERPAPVRPAEDTRRAVLPLADLQTAAQRERALDEVARVHIEVLRQHRKSLSADMVKLDGLTGFYELMISEGPPTSMLQLEAAIDCLDKLTKVRERLIRVERIAWGMDGEKPDGPDDKPQLSGDQLQALRETLVARVRHQVTIEGKAEEVAA